MISLFKISLTQTLNGNYIFTTFWSFYRFREANLQCAVIDGLVKAARYEPGDTSLPESKWNAVHCGPYGWQIVHPFWICRALFGQTLGGWVKVEADGQSLHKQESARGEIIFIIIKYKNTTCSLLLPPI